MIDFRLPKHSVPAFDAVYFMLTSVPEEWRQENDVELLNVHYDALIEASGSNSSEYPWELFLFEINEVFKFFPPIMVIQMSTFAEQLQFKTDGNEAFDERKLAMLVEFVRQVIHCMKEWGWGQGGELYTKRLYEYQKELIASKPTGTAWLKDACAKFVPARYLEGRDPSYYASCKQSLASLHQMQAKTDHLNNPVFENEARGRAPLGDGPHWATGPRLAKLSN